MKGSPRYRKSVVAAMVVALLLVGGLGGPLRPDPANADSATHRPISDFVNAQGTTMVFFPPVPDYVGWSSALNKPPVRFALVDYAGLANEFIEDHVGGFSLGTTIDGSVLERSLADGRAEVTVILHTKNALAWVSAGDPNGSLLFGFRTSDIMADLTRTPGLAESHLMVVFKNTAPGAPLPDLVAAFILGTPGPGQELVFISFHANAKGPLHAVFGVPEGTPGRAIVTQTGVLLRGPFKGATADGFPAESVELRVIGK